MQRWVLALPLLQLVVMTTTAMALLMFALPQVVEALTQMAASTNPTVLARAQRMHELLPFRALFVLRSGSDFILSWWFVVNPLLLGAVGGLLYLLKKMEPAVGLVALSAVNTPLQVLFCLLALDVAVCAAIVIPNVP